MWQSGSRMLSRTIVSKNVEGNLQALAISAAATTCWFYGYSNNTAHCDAQPHNPSGTTATSSTSRLVRKQTALQHAASSSRQQPQRFHTREELSKLRVNEKEMLLRWERDEDGWRELPARAWPPYQPNPEQLQAIELDVTKHGCRGSPKTSNEQKLMSTICQELIFHAATAMVFYNVDPETGLKEYEALARQGHVDSMVACGVVLVEGMGVPPREKEGIEWLKKAVAQNSAQGCYELGSVLYVGVEGVLEEDSEAAFRLFQKAAEQDHTGGMYMVADCLVEGEGTKANVGQAIPLFYKAAERGHRYSRQRIRELLAKKEYQSD